VEPLFKVERIKKDIQPILSLLSNQTAY